jgi:outer membrane protein assembly factor BamB
VILVKRGRSTVYAASFRGELVALDIADGHLLWNFSTASLNPDCQMPYSPVIVGDWVFYAGLDGVLYSFDGVSGKLRWKHDLGKRITTKLSVVENSLYLGTSASRLLRISAEDGQIQSEFSVPAIPEGRNFSWRFGPLRSSGGRPCWVFHQHRH